MSTATLSRMLNLAVDAERLRTGYDQGQRWAWLGGQPKPGQDPAATQILPDRECDCSSLCLGLAWLAGYGVTVTGTAWTGNAEHLLRAAGFSSTDVTGWTLAAISARMQPGDMILGPGHIVLVGADRRVLSAETDERGRSAGGQTGDQTGREVYWRQLYARARQWTRLLRPPATPDAAVPVVPPLAKPTEEKLVVDGELGPKTIGRYQRHMGTPDDGVISLPDSALVRAVQQDLNQRGFRDWDGRKLTIDGQGIQSNSTHRFPTGQTRAYPKGKSRTVHALQKSLGVGADGVLDKGDSATIRALQQYLNDQLSAAAL